jgi:hypothetical protein
LVWWLVGLLFGWLVCWLFGWLFDWLFGWFVCLLVGWLVCWLVCLFVGCLFVGWLVDIQLNGMYSNGKTKKEITLGQIELDYSACLQHQHTVF